MNDEYRDDNNGYPLELILLRGVSGAGKSTLAEIMAGGCDAVAISADEWMVNDDDPPQYTFDPARLREVHERCYEKAEQTLADRVSVVIHNTSTRAWEVERYRLLAKTAGARFHVLTVETGWRDPKTVKNIHNVPEYVIAQQRNRMDVLV